MYVLHVCTFDCKRQQKTWILKSCAWYTQLCGYTPLSAKKIIYMHPELFVDRTCHTTTTNAVADATTSWHPRVWLSTRLLYIMWYTCTCTHVCMHTEKDGMIMITWVHIYTTCTCMYVCHVRVHTVGKRDLGTFDGDFQVRI